MSAGHEPISEQGLLTGNSGKDPTATAELTGSIFTGHCMQLKTSVSAIETG